MILRVEGHVSLHAMMTIVSFVVRLVTGLGIALKMMKETLITHEEEVAIGDGEEDVDAVVAVEDMDIDNDIQVSLFGSQKIISL